MILYFTATGNSAYAAKKLGRLTEDAVLDLFQKLREKDYSPVRSDRPWVLVAPTYAWQLPRLVRDWILRTELQGSREIYFVMTCGDGIGNAGKYLEKLCLQKGMLHKGCLELVMPENYLAMFPVPDKEKSLEIIRRALPHMEKAAKLIRAGEVFPEKRIRLLDSMLSGPVNRLFYRFHVSAKKFYATDACISCGRCEAVCPLKNVRISEGKPVWGKSCTHCMACICTCPAEAIEYGNISKGKNRYRCPEKI